jgi:hypothetical protein
VGVSKKRSPSQVKIKQDHVDEVKRLLSEKGIVVSSEELLGNGVVDLVLEVYGESALLTVITNVDRDWFGARAIITA